MDKIKLVRPTPADEERTMDYLREHREQGEQDIHGGSLLEKMDSYTDWLDHLNRTSDEKTVAPGWVPSSTFFGVRESDGRIIGLIDIRHKLNDYMRDYGGHIGYGIRPSERKKGYATEMLRLALEYCRSIGLEKVMLACYQHNTASAKTIKRCGGQLERESLYSDGKMFQIYWINLAWV